MLEFLWALLCLLAVASGGETDHRSYAAVCPPPNPSGGADCVVFVVREGGIAVESRS